MGAFKGAKPGDIVQIETPAESGHALVERVTERGVEYTPIGGAWQRGRFHREPAKATQIKGVWRRLKV